MVPGMVSAFFRIKIYHVKFWHLFCWRLLRLSEVKKFQMMDQAYISTTQEATEHQFLVHLSKHLVKPGLYFVSKPNGRPCSTLNIWIKLLGSNYLDQIFISIFTSIFFIPIFLFYINICHSNFYVSHQFSYQFDNSLKTVG